MTVNEILTLFRRQSEDSAYTHDRDMPDSISLWSNYQLIQYLNQGQNEFAEETYCFKDGDTFSLSLTGDVPTYEIDERILKVERAELLSTNRMLALKTIEEFQQSSYYDDYGHRRSASWEEHTGTPNSLITDITSDEFRVYPIPTEDDTIKLTVRRLPLYTLTALTDELELPERYQYGLLYKLQKEAYSNPKALLMGYGDALMIATKSWSDFVSNASKRIKIKTRGPGKVRYGGI
jgi:hypothetical protein